MKDIRSIVIKGLISAIEEVTDKKCYTLIPDTAGVNYPYIHISDTYQEEVGDKTKFMYKLDTLIEVVFENITSKVEIWQTMDQVLSIVNNASSFELDSPYKVIRCELNNSTESDFKSETGTQYVGFIRLNIYVE